MGAVNFTETLHDSKTLPEALEQYERLTGQQAAQVFVDRGYKGLRQYKESQIHVPKPDKNISRGQAQKKPAKQRPLNLSSGILKKITVYAVIS